MSEIVGSCEQRLEWSKSEEFVLNVVDQSLAFGDGQRHRFLGKHALGQTRDFRMDLLRSQRRQLGQIHPVDQRPVQTRLHLLERMLTGAVRCRCRDQLLLPINLSRSAMMLSTRGQGPLR